MKLPLFDLNLLRVFDAIVATRSVSKAAVRLGLQQPAVSAALARLRSYFDDELFVRAAGAMNPTPKAVRLSRHIAMAMQALQTALEDEQFTPLETKRTFTVASTDYTTMVLVPHVIALMQDEAPNTNLRIIGYDKGDVATLIDTGEIDLALGVFRSPSERCVRQYLCEEHFVGLARHDHPLVARGEIPLHDYVAAEHALVSVNRDMVGEIDATLARHGLKRRISLTLPHMMALPPILAQSDLIAAVPNRFALQVINAELGIFRLPFDVPAWRIEMLWNPASRRDASSAWLRAKILEAARTV